MTKSGIISAAAMILRDGFGERGISVIANYFAELIIV